MSTPKAKSEFINPLLQDTRHTSPAAPPPPAPRASENTFEQRHRRLTVWVDVDLLERFDAFCRQQGKGARTRFINEAIADLLRKQKIK